MFRSILLVFFFSLLFSVNGNETFVIPEDMQKIKLGKKLEIMEDKTGKISFEEVSSGKFENKFIQSDDDSPNMGYTNSAYWARITLTQNFAQEKSYLILLPYHSLDRIDYYELEAKSIKPLKKIITGDFFPAHDRPFFYREFLFSIRFKQYQEKTFYFRIQSQGTVVIPIVIYEPIYFQKVQILEETSHGIYYGAMMALFLYNFFIFLSIKDGSYLLYICYIGSYTILQSVGHGHAFLYLWPYFPVWSNMALPFFVGLTIFFGSLFTMRFLKTYIYARWMNYVLKVLSVLGVSISILSFFIKLNIINQFAIIIGLTAGISIITTGVITFLNNYRPARYFLLAWGVFIIGVIITALRMLGIYPNTDFSRYVIQVGSLGEAILLSFALADKINIIKKENQEAITRTILYQEQANAELETKVKERTKELNKYIIAFQKDLMTAKNIQLNMLPKIVESSTNFEIVTRYLPLDEVGGDFYDIHFINKYKLRIFIADATGHGVQAALVTMSIKSEYDSLKNLMSDPAELLEELHRRFLYLYRNTNVYFTSAVIDIDIAKSKLFYASAGHPNQFLIQNNRIIDLPKTGHIIGMITGKPFIAKQMDFFMGDRLILFTDGLYEEFNRTQEQFGDERLRKAIVSNIHSNINELVNSTLDALQNFLGGKSRQDDITIIGIETHGVKK
jgi:serine phosphatase RsbU (regulator of sigma subunit)